jgi:hypothetical protein
VPGRKPTVEQLSALERPALVLLAELSKVHDIRRVEANGRKSLRNAGFATLPDATHHTLPMLPATELDRLLVEFLG